MKSRTFIAALTLMALPLFAHASCEAVKSDIDAKIKANGVSNYSLDVVAADQADKGEGKVVGQCEGNKAIVYSRGQSTAGSGDSSHTPKESPAGAGKSGAATPPAGATSMPPPQAVGRSGQTGG
ncbi:DUF1161 domain-containing protein [Dyella sp.]|uniref:DUF1161 domain-containing protein n=1 Tax=Dyella sp. TaxID=1869338 RepID=UPI002845D24F|nr:DUF1161 domain-containing protein [Dyella sp.]MDR3447511.1 DUF1161 domain-containing protein [Dyella sp.]